MAILPGEPGLAGSLFTLHTSSSAPSHHVLSDRRDGSEEEEWREKYIKG